MFPAHQGLTADSLAREATDVPAGWHVSPRAAGGLRIRSNTPSTGEFNVELGNIHLAFSSCCSGNSGSPRAPRSNLGQGSK